MKMTFSSSCCFFFCFFFFIFTARIDAQLSITATTPQPSSDPNTPNTFVGTLGDQIASSLLDSPTPALMWGVVSSSSVNQACDIIVNQGTTALSATVSDWGDTENLQFQIQDSAGCLAATDGSGTEILFTDNYNRKGSVVCPDDNAGSIGCGVYITGDDINDLYNSYNGNSNNKNNNGSKRRLLTNNIPGPRRSLLNCQSGAGTGAIVGTATGILETGDCLALGPLAPFCVIGVLGANAEVGAAGGCVSSCFPGDAMVQTYPHGTFKQMSQLQIGEKVAVLGHNNRVMYEDIYAFGHKDPNANATFLFIKAEPLMPTMSPLMTTHNIHLRLTHMHFLPTAAPTSMSELLANNGVTKNVIYKRAQDVQVGDIVWATITNDEVVAPCVVKDISLIRSQGLYNPFTLSGTLIVDGIVASSHSDWFLDSTFDAMGLTSYLPSAYQTLLAPVRFLYHIMGKQVYLFTYNILDASLDVAAFGTYYGAHITIATLCGTITSTLVVFVMIRTKLHNKLHS